MTSLALSQDLNIHRIHIARATCMRRILKTMYPSIRSPLIYRFDYEFLFAVILSAQTTDVQVNKVTPGLFAKYSTLKSIARETDAQFAKSIASINHYKTKARHIVQTASLLLTEWNSRVPTSLADLMRLPGVGRKSANVVMSELWGKPEGIAVDTHVIRLTQKYGLSRHSDPLKIEQDLMRIIPKREWATFPLRLIQYGRDHCPARCKNCPTCPLWQCVAA